MPGTGVEYSADLERRLAAQWAGHRYDPEYLALSIDEQNAVVASYRAANRIQQLIEHERAKELRRRQKLNAVLGKVGKSE